MQERLRIKAAPVFSTHYKECLNVLDGYIKEKTGYLKPIQRNKRHPGRAMLFHLIVYLIVVLLKCIEMI
ncbi:Alanine--Trna Ligase, Cytoplasmic [Manis pentadactyla]|nr:Alanine--Trna Ligase, Cytoplasmic [Manis pentadactyla]